jgi:hypothetical protein
MILCDVCDGGYHFECVDPPLTCIPVGDWICLPCKRARRRAQTKKEQDKTFKAFQDRIQNAEPAKPAKLPQSNVQAGGEVADPTRTSRGRVKRVVTLSASSSKEKGEGGVTRLEADRVKRVVTLSASSLVAASGAVLSCASSSKEKGEGGVTLCGGGSSDNPWALVECQQCGSGDGEDRIILCDACDGGWHFECASPPLTCVPEGEWICHVCRRARKRT